MMIQIAILGFGVVGSGVAEVLEGNRRVIEKNIGKTVAVKRILDLRDFPDSPFGSLVTHDFEEILSDPDISIVAEMMGGSHPAYDFTKAALEAGKSVVTSNKEVVANFGAELLKIAAAHGVRYLFEASVGGGIPIIRPMINDLSANEILTVNGILNGTTNYILTQMIESGTSFADALSDAQKKGYAEANPAADVEGLDAARKIVILAALSFGKLLDPKKIACEGITKLTGEDAAVAKALGCSVKLIAHTEKANGKILATVAPCLVPACNPLSEVADVFNGILVNANMVGEVMFYGKGAGKLPTASAVVADILDIVTHADKKPRDLVWEPACENDYADEADYRTAFCFSFADTANAAQLAALPSVRTAKAAGRVALLTPPLTRKEVDAILDANGAKPLSILRVL